MIPGIGNQTKNWALQAISKEKYIPMDKAFAKFRPRSCWERLKELKQKEKPTDTVEKVNKAIKKTIEIQKQLRLPTFSSKESDQTGVAPSPMKPNEDIKYQLNIVRQPTLLESISSADFRDQKWWNTNHIIFKRTSLLDSKPDKPIQDLKF